MAGVQYFCRKLFVNNTRDLINRNDVLLQPMRRRLHMVFHNSSQQRKVLQQSKVFFEKDKQIIYRLASTNAYKPKETVSDLKSENPKALNESIQLNSESGVVVSNSDVVVDENLLPPAPVTEVPEMEFISMGLKEPSFESLGLDSWWPPGIIRKILEFLHIDCDLPWWQAIVAITIASRILLFPVTVSVKKDTIVFMNHLPMIKEFQLKITEARKCGDYHKVAAETQEMQKYIQDNKINLFSFFKTAVIQGPVFLSMYWGLKGMSALPVESLKTGGLFWFTDLSAPDPYYILPLVLSSTLLLIIETGAEGKPAGANSHTMKWILRGFPLIILVVSTKFSACITWYWTVSNLIALGQSNALRIPAVAKLLKLPTPIAQPPIVRQTSEKGFIEGFKEGLMNAKITSQVEDRQRLNLIEFQRAGNSPVPRTFKKNPVLEKKK